MTEGEAIQAEDSQISWCAGQILDLANSLQAVRVSGGAQSGLVSSGYTLDTQGGAIAVGGVRLAGYPFTVGSCTKAEADAVLGRLDSLTEQTVALTAFVEGEYQQSARLQPA